MRHEGTIKAVRLDRGFGFIRRTDDDDLFFHATGLASELAFEEQLTERRVTFELITTSRGPRAVAIRPAI